MALGRKPKVAANTDQDIKSENPTQGEGLYDPENADGKGRKMSRVVGDSDTDSALSVGKQLELEQTNSIKYRTCSWPKVN